MPPRQHPPSDPRDPRRDEQRPTLPPIRQIFGTELSQAVPLQQSRQPSSSPQIAFHHLAIADDDRRNRPQSPAAGLRGNPSYSQSHPSVHGPSRPTTPMTHHPRNASDPAQRSAYGLPQPLHQHAYPPQASHLSRLPQTFDSSVMASGTYPYDASQARHRAAGPIAGTSSAAEIATAERSSSSRYECSYCGKGFTRPSSLKIHLNTHTGEKPFTCPYEGCGRSFSVQSNMRRHARVHERGSGSQPDADYESLEENDDNPSTSSNADKPGDTAK